ncbi:DUF4177 domain-containing protein [Clostridiaceae bacterium M8S5]|nr:DUF4177 domain-containing protein [Clostridiaceae bacterium M8S5]
MYEYKSVEVPLKKGLKAKVGVTFDECMKIIKEHAQDGWRLVQIVTPQNEKAGAFMPYAYQIIFEKKI